MVHEFTLLNRSWFALKKVHKDKKVLFDTLGIQLDVILEIKTVYHSKDYHTFKKDVRDLGLHYCLKDISAKKSFSISSGCVTDPLNIANLTLDIHVL